MCQQSGSHQIANHVETQSYYRFELACSNSFASTVDKLIFPIKGKLFLPMLEVNVVASVNTLPIF